MSKWILGLNLLSFALSLPPCYSLADSNKEFRQTTCHLETFLFEGLLRVNGSFGIVQLAPNSIYQLSKFPVRDDRAFPEVKWLTAGSTLEINNKSICVLDLQNGSCDIRSVAMIYHEFSQQQNDGLLQQIIMNQPFIIGIDPPPHLSDSTFETAYSLCEPSFLDVSGAIYSNSYNSNRSSTDRSIPDACINDGYPEEKCRSVFDETINNYCKCGNKELNAPETALVITKKEKLNFLALFSMPVATDFKKDMRYEESGRPPVFKTPENYFLTDGGILPKDKLLTDNYWDCVEPYSKLQIFQNHGLEMFFSRTPMTINLSGKNYTLPKKYRVVTKPSTLVMKIETNIEGKVYKASKLIRIADFIKFETFFPKASLTFVKSDEENHYFTIEISVNVPEDFYDFRNEEERLVQVFIYAFHHMDFRILDAFVHEMVLVESKSIKTISIPRSRTLNNLERTIDMLDGYVTLSEEPRLDDKNILLQDATEGVKLARKSKHCHQLHEFCDAVTYTPSMPSFEKIFSDAYSTTRFTEFVNMAYVNSVNDKKRIEIDHINPCCPDHQFEKGFNLTTTKTLRIEMHQLASMLYNKDKEDCNVILYFSTYSFPLYSTDDANSPCSIATSNFITNPAYFVRKPGTKFGRRMYEGENVSERHYSGIYWNISSDEIFQLHKTVNSDSNGTHMQMFLWISIEFNTSDSKRQESPCIIINDGYDISGFVEEQRAVNRNNFIVLIIKVVLLFLLLALILVALSLLRRKWQKLWKESKPTAAQLTLYPVHEASDDLSAGDSNRTTKVEEPLNSISDTSKDENDNLLNRYFPAETKGSPFEQMSLIESDIAGYKFNPMMHSPNQPRSQVLQSAPTLQPDPLMQADAEIVFNCGTSEGYKTMEAISFPSDNDYK